MTITDLICLVLSFFTAASWSASMRLPSFPLAVKTPYLSVWMPGHLSDDFPSATPEFWNGQPLTWIIMARIEDTTYCLMGCTDGRPGTVQAVQKAINFTSTHTYVTLQAGSTELTMDFFSPVDPVNHVRQSLPFSYITVSSRSEDGSTPDIGLISAIDSSWLADRGTPYANITTVNGRRILALDGEDGREFSEDRQMARWGKVVLSSRAESEQDDSTCQVGDPNTIFNFFVNSGVLPASVDTMRRDSIAACTQTMSSKDLSGGTFAVGLYQDYEMQYFDGEKIEYYVGYFRSKVSNMAESINYFLDDYEEALAASHKFDKRIVDIGKATSTNYSDLLEFTIRQSFAGQQVMIFNDTLDTAHPYSFIKEISTDGNVNTLADLIPKALPVFHVLNPEYTRMMLEPVLRFSLNAWPLNHAVHDIGKRYPNATGERPCIEEFLPLDSTSVLLWMLYLYQDSTANADLTERYAPILKVYADYCYKYGLYPVLQRSSVDALGSATNQSALSISAAIALNAYGKMTGDSKYSKFGIDMAKKIVQIGTDANKTHLLTHYTDGDEAWVLMYPLAFDAWLRLDTFPKEVYKMQSDWYSQHTYTFGVQYRNNIRYTLMEWLMWVGAISPDALRDHFVNAVHRFLNQETGPMESVPGPTQWRVLPGTDEGVWTHFSKAKSVIGSIFMIAAVQGGFNETFAAPRYFVPLQSSVLTTPQDDLSQESPRTKMLRASRANEEMIHDTSSGLPFVVPEGASLPADPSFLGLSFDMAAFHAYAGNRSHPAQMSIDLIRNLIRASGSPITLRIGGREADHSVYDPIQLTPLERVDIEGKSVLSIGPSFFDGIAALNTIVNSNWIYQVPFASLNRGNAVQGTKAAIQVIPDQHLYALEIGHKVNEYANNGSRPQNYNCQKYAAELFEFKIALRRNIGRIGNQFQALGLSHSHIDDSWTMEECFTAGIEAQNDLQSVSSHYSHFESHHDLRSSDLPRHKDIVHQHKKFLPQVRYLRTIFSCHPFVISEASLISWSDDNDDLTEEVSKPHHDDPLGLAIWTLDFLLYSMSHNVSKVLMHQSCNSVSSAWTPKACFLQANKKRHEGQINAPYSAYTFVASFLRDARDFRVVQFQHDHEDSIVYAGYEAGKLSKVAVVNYPPAGSADAEEKRLDVVKLRLPAGIVAVEEVTRISSSSLTNAAESGLASESWSSRNGQQVPLGFKRSEPLFDIRDGNLNVELPEGGAVLFEVR